MRSWMVAVLVLVGFAAVALAWPPAGQQVPPGHYMLTQTNPVPPPDHGGDLDIGPGSGAGNWVGHDGSAGPVWWDSLKNAYELPNGNYLFMYPGPPNTWVQTDSSGTVIASGTYVP